MVQASEHAEMIMKQVVKARKAQIESKKKFDEEKNKAARTKRSEAYEEMRKTVIATQENVEVSEFFTLWSSWSRNCLVGAFGNILVVQEQDAFLLQLNHIIENNA